LAYFSTLHSFCRLDLVVAAITPCVVMVLVYPSSRHRLVRGEVPSSSVGGAPNCRRKSTKLDSPAYQIGGSGFPNSFHRLDLLVAAITPWVVMVLAYPSSRHHLVRGEAPSSSVGGAPDCRRKLTKLDSPIYQIRGSSFPDSSKSFCFLIRFVCQHHVNKFLKEIDEDENTLHVAFSYSIDLYIFSLQSTLLDLAIDQLALPSLYITKQSIVIITHDTPMYYLCHHCSLPPTPWG
jgi:hypothetical protein